MFIPNACKFWQDDCSRVRQGDSAVASKMERFSIAMLLDMVYTVALAVNSDSRIINHSLSFGDMLVMDDNIEQSARENLL